MDLLDADTRGTIRTVFIDVLRENRDQIAERVALYNPDLERDAQALRDLLDNAIRRIQLPIPTHDRSTANLSRLSSFDHLQHQPQGPRLSPIVTPGSDQNSSSSTTTTTDSNNDKENLTSPRPQASTSTSRKRRRSSLRRDADNAKKSAKIASTRLKQEPGLHALCHKSGIMIFEESVSELFTPNDTPCHQTYERTTNTKHTRHFAKPITTNGRYVYLAYGYENQLTTELAIFDRNAGTYTSSPMLNEPREMSNPILFVRDETKCETIDDHSGRLYVYGGLPGNRKGVVSSVEMLQIDHNGLPVGNWQRFAGTDTKWCKEQSSAGVVYYNQLLYRFGGFIPGSKFQPKITTINLITNESTVLDVELPHPLMGVTAVLVDTKVYLIGGYLTPSQVTDEVFEFDLSTNQLRAMPRMCVPRADAPAVHYNGCLYVFGGFDNSGTPHRTIEKFDFNKQKWKTERQYNLLKGGEVGAIAV